MTRIFCNRGLTTPNKKQFQVICPFPLKDRGLVDNKTRAANGAFWVAPDQGTKPWAPRFTVRKAAVPGFPPRF